MKSLFLIVLGAKLDREQVIEYLSQMKGFGVWFYSMPNSFFIYSSLSAARIVEIMKDRYGTENRYFAVKVTNSQYYGWMPKDHWAIVHNQGAEMRYDLVFKGYYLDPSLLMASSGVYCVYRCTYRPDTNAVVLNELLYIGQAENVCERHRHHENLLEWERCLLAGEKLCYTCAEVPIPDLRRCEAALIYHNQPRCNHYGKESFNYLDTYLSVSGSVALLKSDVVVQQTK